MATPPRPDIRLTRQGHNDQTLRAQVSREFMAEILGLRQYGLTEGEVIRRALRHALRYPRILFPEGVPAGLRKTKSKGG